VPLIIVATLLLALQGPALVLAGGAALALASTVITMSGGRIESPPPGPGDDAESRGPVRTLLSSVAALRSRSHSGGVFAIACGHFVLVGAIDLVVVVLAADELGLGSAGPGLLQTSVGVGALLCALYPRFWYAAPPGRC
jgi:hypothetical protein